METTMNIKSTAEGSAKIAKTTTQLSGYDKFIKNLEFSYFGLITMTITLGSIIGGITAMFIFKNDAPVWQLGFAMVGGMANLVSAVAQAPTKWLFNIFVGSTILNTLLILINAF